MSPGFLSTFTTIALLGVVFASTYIRIRMAKKRVAKWKRGSTFWFVSSMRAYNRAKVWMEELGYDEAEAQILAEYQLQAIFFAILGGTIVILTAIALPRA
jgi:hypothetical protein